MARKEPTAAERASSSGELCSESELEAPLFWDKSSSVLSGWVNPEITVAKKEDYVQDSTWTDIRTIQRTRTLPSHRCLANWTTWSKFIKIKIVYCCKLFLDHPVLHTIIQYIQYIVLHLLYVYCMYNFTSMLGEYCKL